MRHADAGSHVDQSVLSASVVDLQPGAPKVGGKPGQMLFEHTIQLLGRCLVEIAWYVGFVLKRKL